MLVLAAGCGSSSGDDTASSSSGSTTTKAAATPTATAEQIKDDDGDGIEDPVTVKGALGDSLELNGSGLGNKDPPTTPRPRSRSR